jgi:hypothetical protein
MKPKQIATCVPAGRDGLRATARQPPAPPQAMAARMAPPRVNNGRMPQARTDRPRRGWGVRAAWP